jgi:hypothetical protein
MEVVMVVFNADEVEFRWCGLVGAKPVWVGSLSIRI